MIAETVWVVRVSEVYVLSSVSAGVSGMLRALSELAEAQMLFAGQAEGQQVRPGESEKVVLLLALRVPFRCW